jgi:hypothetical protein
MKFILVSLFLLSLSGHVDAAEKMDGMGIGVRTCAKFADDMRTTQGAEGIYFTWAQGFMSGVNSMLAAGKHRDLGGKSVEAEQSFIREFCDQRPLARYLNAVEALFHTLPNL